MHIRHVCHALQVEASFFGIEAFEKNLANVWVYKHILYVYLDMNKLALIHSNALVSYSLVSRLE